jgi:hypothetical protein
MLQVEATEIEEGKRERSIYSAIHHIVIDILIKYIVSHFNMYRERRDLFVILVFICGVLLTQLPL